MQFFRFYLVDRQWSDYKAKNVKEEFEFHGIEVKRIKANEGESATRLHCRAFEDFISSTAKYCVVVEPDSFLTCDFKRIFDLVEENLEICWLGMTMNYHRHFLNTGRGRPSPILTENSPNTVINNIPLGSFGYLVSRDFAFDFLSLRPEAEYVDVAFWQFCRDREIPMICLKEPIVYLNVWNNKNEVEIYEECDLNLYQPDIERQRQKRNPELKIKPDHFEIGLVQNVVQRLVLIGTNVEDTTRFIHGLQFRDVEVYAPGLTLPKYPHVQIVDEIPEDAIRMRVSPYKYFSRSTFDRKWENISWVGHHVDGKDYFIVGNGQNKFFDPIEFKKYLFDYFHLKNKVNFLISHYLEYLNFEMVKEFEKHLSAPLLSSLKGEKTLRTAFEKILLKADGDVVSPEHYPDILYTSNRKTKFQAREIRYVELNLDQIEEIRKEAIKKKRTYFGACFNEKHSIVQIFQQFKKIVLISPGEETEARFVLVVEDSIVDAFKTGAIPIYYGSAEVFKYFNPKSFIYLHDYSTIELAIKEIKEIEYSDKYQEMLNEKVLIGEN